MNDQQTALLHSRADQAAPSAGSLWPAFALFPSRTTELGESPRHANLKQVHQNHPEIDRLSRHFNPLDINELNLQNAPLRLVLGGPGPRENPQTTLQN